MVKIGKAKYKKKIIALNYLIRFSENFKIDVKDNGINVDAFVMINLHLSPKIHFFR